MQTEDESSASQNGGQNVCLSNGTLECPHISIENCSKFLFANAMFWHLEDSDVRLNVLYERICRKQLISCLTEQFPFEN